MRTRIVFLTCLLFVLSSAPHAGNTALELGVNQQLWLEFTAGEKATLLAKFPQIEIVPSETVGVKPQ
jgi:hypothetical protein